MVREEVEVHPYADLSPLRDALAECGGTLYVVAWASVPGTRSVYVEYPQDEYFEKRCRALVDGWRLTGPAE